MKWKTPHWLGSLSCVCLLPYFRPFCFLPCKDFIQLNINMCIQCIAFRFIKAGQDNSPGNEEMLHNLNWAWCVLLEPTKNLFLSVFLAFCSIDIKRYCSETKFLFCSAPIVLNLNFAKNIGVCILLVAIN